MKTFITKLFPRKQWVITWGCGFAFWKPRKEQRCFWFGEPVTFFDGCGPFENDKIDEALAEFVTTYEKHHEHQ